MYRLFVFSLFSIFLFISCEQSQDQDLIIAISKAKPMEYYGNYSTWVKKEVPNASIINMYELGVDSALAALDYCNGLIISGGADVYPEWYGKLSDTARCGDFDRYRDTLEIELIRKAIEHNIPLLGICRGEQIINVTLGGSLVIDIPSDHDTLVQHRQDDWQNCYHSVDLVETSLTSLLLNKKSGIVNSNHHQAIDQLANDLMISSKAKDGIAESVEWKIKEDKGFLMAVQWHPERLDTVHPEMSLPILKAFIDETKKYQFPKQ